MASSEEILAQIVNREGLLMAVEMLAERGILLDTDEKRALVSLGVNCGAAKTMNYLARAGLIKE